MPTLATVTEGGILETRASGRQCNLFMRAQSQCSMKANFHIRKEKSPQSNWDGRKSSSCNDSNIANMLKVVTLKYYIVFVMNGAVWCFVGGEWKPCESVMSLYCTNCSRALCVSSNIC